MFRSLLRNIFQIFYHMWNQVEKKNKVQEVFFYLNFSILKKYFQIFLCVKQD